MLSYKNRVWWTESCFSFFWSLLCFSCFSCKLKWFLPSGCHQVRQLLSQSACGTWTSVSGQTDGSCGAARPVRHSDYLQRDAGCDWLEAWPVGVYKVEGGGEVVSTSLTHLKPCRDQKHSKTPFNLSSLYLNVLPERSLILRISKSSGSNLVCSDAKWSFLFKWYFWSKFHFLHKWNATIKVSL